MIPNINQDAQFKKQVEKTYFMSISKLFTVSSLKILKRDFNFSPDEINRFCNALEKEIKGGGDETN